jgi:hypothetical protein
MPPTIGTDPGQDIIGLGVLFLGYLQLRAGHRSIRTETKTDEIHKMVNSTNDALQAANDQLTEDVAQAKREPAETSEKE